MSFQFSLCLPRQSTDDALRERLAAAVEAANATTDPAERVRLHTEITELRRILRQDGAR